MNFQYCTCKHIQAPSEKKHRRNPMNKMTLTKACRPVSTICYLDIQLPVFEEKRYVLPCSWIQITPFPLSCSSLWSSLHWQTGSCIFLLPDVVRHRMCNSFWIQLLPVRSDQGDRPGGRVAIGSGLVLRDRDEGPAPESTHQRYRGSVISFKTCIERFIKTSYLYLDLICTDKYIRTKFYVFLLAEVNTL